MQSSHVTNGASAGSKTFFHQRLKTLGYDNGAKRLGDAANPELAQWYEDAYAYYQQVQTGQTPRPDAVSWQEFMEQMQWAYGQLTSASQGSWDPVTANGAANGNSSPTDNDPFGAMRGANGNWIHNETKAKLGFIGNDQRDIWSNEIDLEITPLSAKIEIIKTVDESGQPPEEVLKIRVTDPATGTEAIYVIHDFEDAKIRIHAPNPAGQIEDLTGLNPAIVEAIELTEASGINQGPEASIPGEVLEERENALLYEGFAGEPVEFRVTGNGIPGDTQYHVVYGDTVIRTRPTDEVAISQDATGVLVITITHRDGSIDVLEVQEGYEATVYAREQALTIDGIAYQDLEEIPEAFAEALIVNGKEDSAAAQKFPEDTTPDRIETGIAYFNSQSTVSLHQFYDGNEGNHDITTGGVFELHAHNFEDQVAVFITPEGNYRIVVSNPAYHESIEYFVKGPPGQVLLNGFLPAQVDVYRSNSQSGFGGVVIHKFDTGATSQYQSDDAQALERIQLNSTNAVQPGEVSEQSTESNENMERMEYFLEVAGKSWEQLLAAIRAAGYGNFGDVADLQEQVRAGHFPLEIGPNAPLEYNATMISIMYNLDSEFFSKVNAAWDWNGNTLSSNYHQAAQRLQVLLSSMYPDHNISLRMGQADSGQWRRNNEIVIDGQSYNFTNEARNHTDELMVDEAE